MSKYTLKQMLDKFERNPDLKFKFVEDEPYEGTEGQVIILDEIGRVVNEEGKSILSCFNLNSKFSLVNEPVDKMEALKAFWEGKAIYCWIGGKKFNYYPDKINDFTELTSDQGCSISIEEILHGKWFIEEKEK